MATKVLFSKSSRGVMRAVRERIASAEDRVWRLEDFSDLPMETVVKALSRLVKEGTLQRLSKGTYFSPRQTPFGKSLPNPADIRELAARRRTIFPSGIAAANLLGFTTQSGKHSELATSSPSLPRKLIGKDAIVHTRRPAAWANLENTDAALLDFLRNGGRTSELSPEATIRRTVALMSEQNRFERLLRVAATEPPRVRAILGAIGQSLKRNAKVLKPLRTSLNPLSRFDFGVFAKLLYASKWQSKSSNRK